MQLLQQARAASGLSIVDIAERARQRGYDLDPIDLAQALHSQTLPNWQTVTGVLTASGLSGMQIDRWMRVYHDLAAPAQPTAPTAPAAAAQEPLDEEPVSVPPLVLTTAPATPARLGPRHLAIAGGVLAALIVVPLVLFALLSGDPDNVAAEVTSVPRTTEIRPPEPSPSDLTVVQPSPTDVAAPTTPGPAPTTARPPVRTTAPAPRPPSPADPGVLRSGVVSLSGNEGFDLDSGQGEGDRDIFRWSNDNTLIRANGSLLEPVSGMPTKQGCQAEENWERRVDNLHAGQWLCVRTSDGRYGRINITAVGGMLTLAYTVWT